MTMKSKALDIFKRMINTICQNCYGNLQAAALTGYADWNFIMLAMGFTALGCIVQHLPDLLNMKVDESQ